MVDAETNALKWIDTSDKAVRTQYVVNAKKKEQYLKDLFNKSGVDSANINTSESYIVPLTNLFKRR
jgi:hypothetical protein